MSDVCVALMCIARRNKLVRYMKDANSVWEMVQSSWIIFVDGPSSILDVHWLLLAARRHWRLVGKIERGSLIGRNVVDTCRMRYPWRLILGLDDALRHGPNDNCIALKRRNAGLNVDESKWLRVMSSCPIYFIPPSLLH